MKPVTRNNRFGRFSVAVAMLCGVALAAVATSPGLASEKKRIRAEDDPLYMDAAPKPGKATRSEDDPLYMEGYVAPLQDRPARRAAADDDDSYYDGPWFGPQLWRDDRGMDWRRDHERTDRGDDPRTWN